MPPLGGFCACWPRVRVAVTRLGTGVAAAVPVCPTEVVWGGLSLTERGQAGLGSHRASPAHLATSGGPQCCSTGRSRCHPGRNKGGVGSVHSQVEGTCPRSCSDPAGRRRVWGHLSVCNGCLFILTSSSSPPGLVAGGTQQRGHGSGSAFSRMIFCCSPLEGGLQ